MNRELATLIYVVIPAGQLEANCTVICDKATKKVCYFYSYLQTLLWDITFPTFFSMRMPVYCYCNFYI